MFTGIIKDVGIVKKIVRGENSIILSIESNLKNIIIGDSISVNGLCLTLTKLEKNLLQFDLSFESIARSNFGTLSLGENVNLEPALTISDRLGGHFVTGHIDFASTIIHFANKSNFVDMAIEVPTKYRHQIVEKGSIAVDGVSLTVNEFKENSFSIVLIPHTLQNTNLLKKSVGSLVNIETDLLAKYVESVVDKREKKSVIDENFLAKHGFINS